MGPRDQRRNGPDAYTHFFVGISIVLVLVICFRFCFRDSSGEVPATIATQSMVAGGGGFIPVVHMLFMASNS